jgi:hypothetical protein
MVERSYSNSQLVEIISNALKRWHGNKAAATMLAEGVDLDAVFAALAASHTASEALDILRRALALGGPFRTIPDLSAPFHIRFRRAGITFDGIEFVGNDGILSGANVVMLERDDPLQRLIDEVDRKVCASLAAEGRSLKKDARAPLIRRDLATSGHHLAIGTIKNRIPKRS